MIIIHEHPRNVSVYFVETYSNCFISPSFKYICTKPDAITVIYSSISADLYFTTVAEFDSVRRQLHVLQQ